MFCVMRERSLAIIQINVFGTVKRWLKTRIAVIAVFCTIKMA